MFIYVMKRTIRDKMIKKGYTLIKEDDANNLWIFENTDKLSFDFDENCPHVVFSDVLSF